MYTSVGISHILLVCIFNMDISILMATATSCHSVGKVCGSQNWRQYRRYIYNRAGDIITRRQSCTKRQYFDISEGRCSGIPGGGYIVFVDNNAACNIAGLIPHPTEARYYRVCKSYKVIVAKCQRPANFNIHNLHCGHRYIVSSRDSKLNKSSYHPKLPVCVKAGQFPSPNACSSYYTCRRNGTRFVQTEYKCPQNSVYNATLGNCDIKKECKLKNTSTTLLRPISNEYPKCTAAGKVYVPSNCTMYCMCSSRRSGDFIRECYSCPSGYVYDPNIEVCAEGSHCIQDVEETKYDSQQSVPKIIPQISTSAPYVTSEFKDTAVITTPQLNERTSYHNTPFVRTSELPEYTSVSHPMKYDNTEGADIMNINKQSHHNITQLYPVVDSFEYPKQAYITIKSSTIESYQMDFQSTADTDTVVVTANKSRKKNFTEKDTPKFVMQTHSTLTINIESQNVTEQTLSDIKIYEEKHVVSSKSLKAVDTEFQPTHNTADKVRENKQEFIRPSVASNCISCSETPTIYSKEKENVFENRTEQSFKAPLTTTHSPLNCCKAGQSGLTVSMTQACIETNLLSSECAQTSLPEAVNSSELTCINVNPKPQPTMEPVTLYRDFILKQTQEEHSETDIAEQITPSKTASTTAAHGNKYIHWDWQQTQEINILTADTEISEFQPEEKNVTPSLTKYWRSMLKPAAEHELESSAETEFRTSTYNTQHSNTVTKVISKELPETSSTSILVLKAKEEYTTISETAEQQGVTNNVTHLPPLQTASKAPKPYTEPEDIKTESFLPQTNDTLSKAGPIQHVTASLFTQLPQLQNTNTKQTAHTELENNVNSASLTLPHLKEVTPIAYSDQHGISATTFQPQLPATRTTLTGYSELENNTTPITSTIIHAITTEFEVFTTKQRTASHPTTLPSELEINSGKTHFSDSEQSKKSRLSSKSLPNIDVTKPLSEKQDILVHTSSSSLLHKISTTPMGKSDAENITVSAVLQNSTTGHSDLENITVSTQSLKSQLSTVAPNIYSNGQETAPIMTFLPLSEKTSKVPTSYTDPGYKTVPSVSQTSITGKEASFVQQVTVLPLTPLPLQRSSTEVGPYSEVNNVTYTLQSRLLSSESHSNHQRGTSNTSPLRPLQTVSTTRIFYTYPDNITTVSLMPIRNATLSDAYSPEQVTASLTTLLTPFQSSNTKPETHSEADNNTRSTRLPLPYSKQVAPEGYSDQHGISAMTFLPPFPTTKTMEITDSDPVNNTSLKISTTLESNIIQSESLTSKHKITSLPTLLPSQHKISTEQKTYSHQETYKTSACSLISLSSSKVQKDFTNKQDVLTYTSSPLFQISTTISETYSNKENNTISTVLQTSTTGHSGLDNNAISTSSQMPHLSTVIPIVYADHKKTTTVMTYSQLSETINNGPTSYTDPEYRTVSSVSETIITESDGSLAQQITASPLGLLPLQRSSTELEHHSELKNDTTSYISLTSQLSMAVQTEYSDPNNVTTLSKMSEPTASIHQVTPSLITLLLPLQSITTNKNIAAYSELDSNTNQTGLNLSQSKTIVPKTYSNQNGASDTSLPSLPTNSITLTTFSDLEYNTIQTISTILQTNVTEIEAVSSQQITASPSTLLSPEQEINTKQTNYSDPETSTTSASSLISLTSSEDPKDFSDKQEISTYTSSPLFQIMSTVPGSYSYTENNTVSTILHTTTTGHFDLDNNISSTSSQMSQLSTVEPSVYNDQEITNYMAFLPLSETGEQVATVSPDHDNKSIPTISTLSESSNTESEVYTVYQANTTTLTFLPFEKTGTKVAARLELSNDTNSNSSQTSQSSTVIPKVYSDEQETTAYSTSSPPLWTITTVQKDNNESDKKTIASTSSILGTYVTVPNDYSIIYTVSPGTYLSTVEESKTVLTTSSEQHMEGNTEISSVLQSRTFVSKSYSDQQKVTADAISSQPLQTIHTTPTAYSDPDSMTVSLIPEPSTMASNAYSMQQMTSLITILQQLHNINTKPTAHSDLENNISASLPLSHSNEMAPEAYSNQHGISATTPLPLLPISSTIAITDYDAENNTTQTILTVTENNVTESKAITSQQMTASPPMLLPLHNETDTNLTAYPDQEANETSTCTLSSLPSTEVPEDLYAKQDLSDYATPLPLYQISITTPSNSHTENNTVSTVLETSTIGHSDLDKNTISTSSHMSKLSNVAPNVYVDEQETTTVMTLLSLSEKISKVQTPYTDPQYINNPTMSSVSWTKITESEASFVQYVTVLPHLPLWRSSTELGPDCELHNDTTSQILPTTQIITAVPTDYSDEEGATAYTTPSPQIQTITVVPKGYSDPDNKTVPASQPMP